MGLQTREEYFLLFGATKGPDFPRDFNPTVSRPGVNGAGEPFAPGWEV